MNEGLVSSALDVLDVSSSSPSSKRVVSLTEAKEALRVLALQSSRIDGQTERGKSVCSLLCLRVARAWLPLLQEREIDELWAPWVAACLPWSLGVLTEALHNVESVSEGAVVCSAIESVLLRTPGSLERCMVGVPLAVTRQLCSIPDRCANAAAQKCPPALIGPAFVAVCCQRAAAIVHSCVADVAQLLSCIAARGDATLVALTLLGMDASDAGACLLTCNPQCYARVFPILLAKANDVAHLKQLVGRCVEDDHTARHLLERVLLTQTVHNRVPLLLEFHASRGDQLLQGLAVAVAELWSEPEFTRRADYLLQLQCSRVLVWCCNRVTSVRESVQSITMRGVQQRLGVPELRMLAMGVAESVARGGAVPLEFGEKGLDDLMSFPAVHEPHTIKGTAHHEQNHIPNVAKKNIDPDAVLSLASKGRKGDDDDDDDVDDDSLSSYEMDEEEDAPSGPVYLRDCLGALREKEGDRVMAGLRALVMLIPARPADLSDVALPLARVILSLCDEWSFPDFVQTRSQCLALLATFSAPAAEWLGQQLKERNWSTQQRMECVEAALRAVQLLSDDGQASKPTPPVLVRDSVGDSDGKTRRWGSALHAPAPAPKRSRLAPVAGSLFWPYASALDSSAAGSEPLVLSRLLLLLGQVIANVPLSEEKQRMLGTLAAGVWHHRWNSDWSVTRACAVALTQALLACDPDTLSSEQWASPILKETIAWLSEVAEAAADADTAQVGRTCLAELARHLRHSMDALMSAGGGGL